MRFLILSLTALILTFAGPVNAAEDTSPVDNSGFGEVFAHGSATALGDDTANEDALMAEAAEGLADIAPAAGEAPTDNITAEEDNSALPYEPLTDTVDDKYIGP
jgi:hypothetical protein